jgi:hypothetical protein
LDTETSSRNFSPRPQEAFSGLLPTIPFYLQAHQDGGHLPGGKPTPLDQLVNMQRAIGKDLIEQILFLLQVRLPLRPAGYHPGRRKMLKLQFLQDVLHALH